MKKYLCAIGAIALALSLCGCGCGRTDTAVVPETTQETTTQPETTMPTLPPVKPNIPEETENRGSTDDTSDAANETLPEEIDRMRRRILG